MSNRRAVVFINPSRSEAVSAAAELAIILVDKGFDLVSPTEGVRVSWYLVTGIALTYLGVIVGGVNNSQSRRLQKR